MVEHPVVAAVATTIVSSRLVAFFFLPAAGSNNNTPPPTQPYPLLTYGPIAARLYFDRRWPWHVPHKSLWISPF
jgi:hypothetical protein